MTKKYCDRCKKEMGEPVKEITFTEEIMSVNVEIYKKEICKECMNDFINMVEYECDRYVLKPTVIVSKEAVDDNV